MNKLILYLCFLMLFSCVQNEETQTEDNTKTDSLKPKVLEKKDTVITRYLRQRIFTIHGFDDLKIGTPFKEVKKAFPDFAFKTSEDYFSYEFISKKDSIDLLLIVNDKKVMGIGFYNKRFKMNNGLSVGSPISDFKKLYPDVPIFLNYHDEVECFYFKIDGIYLYVEVESDDKKPLGKYKGKENEEDSDLNYRLNGKITLIRIHNKGKSE